MRRRPGSRRPGSRPIASMAAAGLLAATAVLLAGCGSDGVGLARAACVDVNHSIALFDDAHHADSQQQAQDDEDKAYRDLRAALPLAAQATSQNGNWNALMTTISESARVTEDRLVDALRQQCSVADSQNPDQPPQPTPVGGGGGGPSTTSLSPESPVQPGPSGTGGTVGSLPKKK